MIYLYMLAYFFSVGYMLDQSSRTKKMVQLQEQILEFQKQMVELQKEIIDNLRKKGL